MFTAAEFERANGGRKKGRRVREEKKKSESSLVNEMISE